MSTADDHTLQTLRELRASGKLAQPDGLDDATARALLKTPPMNSLVAVVGGGKQPQQPNQALLASSTSVSSALGSGIGAAAAQRGGLDSHLPLSAFSMDQHHQQYGGSGNNNNNNDNDDGIAALARVMEEDCVAFTAALEDNTRLAKEQMQRSLLQLFEDTAREKLADTFLRGAAGVAHAGGDSSGGVGSTFRAGSGAAAVRSKLQPAMGAALVARAQSRRPVDRGLDKRDAPSDLVIPEAVREQISKDIHLVVDHELRRWMGLITGDIERILQHALGIRDRITRVEEEVIQRQVENRMQADQLTQYGNETAELRAELEQLRAHNYDKDRQMDVLRDQVGRRNQALDETRVRFRKEVMRYKARQQELESEIESLSAKHHGRPRGGGGVGGMERRVSMPDLHALGDDPEARGEILAAAEQAVQETTEKLNEEIRVIHLRHAKEKKAILAEMQAKMSERDHEIMRLKEKLREALQSSRLED